MHESRASEIDEDKVSQIFLLCSESVLPGSSEGPVAIGIRGPCDARGTAGGHRPEKVGQAWVDEGLEGGREGGGEVGRLGGRWRERGGREERGERGKGKREIEGEGGTGRRGEKEGREGREGKEKWRWRGKEELARWGRTEGRK